MDRIPRTLDFVLESHLGELRQMAFVAGPRQVGKTTTCRGVSGDRFYVNWDDQDDRERILAGPAAVAEMAGLERLQAAPPVIVFDELHKYARWKTFLKGLFDRWAEQVRIVVTGSSRLDVYRRGGDSLMGRYFLYRLHPLSVGELGDPEPSDDLIRDPIQLPDRTWGTLTAHGGFPEPFSRSDPGFTRRWLRLRSQQLIREDIRDFTRIQEVSQLEILARILAERSGTQLNYSALARQVRVSVDTMRRWIDTFCSLYHGFLIRPWHRNVSRSLRKEPKWYLRDWSGIRDPGSRAETLVACHLLKAVETWTDAGHGEFELRYLRDKEKREVEFAVIRDGEPWFLVEVKQGDDRLSGALKRFQDQTGAKHAFQAVLDLPFVAADCFSRSDPCIIPARTLLGQLP